LGIGMPSRQAAFRFGFSPYDLVLALAAPIIALYLRNAIVLAPDEIPLATTYCFISAAFSLAAFAAFGIHRGIPEFFTVRDVLNLAKAVFVGEILTSATLFSITRLDGIPRSVPAIHALTLGAGLFTVRVVAHIGASRRYPGERPQAVEEAAILIGVTKLSALYMKMVEAVDHRCERIIALLDDKPHSVGRSVNGIRVFGRAADLDRVIVDFALHGVQVERVVLADEGILAPEAFAEVQRVCVARGLDLTLIPQLLGVDRPESRRKRVIKHTVVRPSAEAAGDSLPRYFRYKRLVDLALVVPLIIILAPAMLVVAAVALVDVGVPVFFWQQRLGLNGRTFLLYKLRTLKEPFDWRGERIPEEKRLSKAGKIVRKWRFDELPQLLNVLVSDMSFIGPRPLLPQDQPSSASVRLMVRPGITGWAQVNGGAIITPEEKGALDEWYVRNASLWLDIKILFLTFRSVITGDRRRELALDRAQRAKNGKSQRIIFLNRFFYPDQSATSQMVSDLAFDLARRAYDVHVFTSRQRYDDPRAQLPQFERVDGVTIHRVETTQFGRATSLGRVFDYLSFYAGVRRAVLAWAEPGDVLVAKTDPPLLSVLGQRLAKRRGLRLINWLQDLYPEVAAKLGVPLLNGALGRKLAAMRDASLRAAAANVVIGEQMAAVVHAHGVDASRMRVIHNWCDDERIFPVLHEENPLRRAWQLDGGFVVAYSGNLGRSHEFDTLLAAAALLRDEQRLVFLFIGGGKKWDELRRAVHERGLEARFVFLPYQDRDALRYSLGAADMHLVSLKPELEGLIVPSKFYGIAAAGRPVLAITAMDGEVAKLVRAHDCGIVVEPGQGALLADMLRNVMRDSDRLQAMGRRARAMLEENFTRHQAFERWRGIIDEVTEGLPEGAPAKAAKMHADEVPVNALS
jgi:colanic acid biosynthesis glycosyl transferase WcaI